MCWKVNEDGLLITLLLSFVSENNKILGCGVADNKAVKDSEFILLHKYLEVFALL